MEDATMQLRVQFRGEQRDIDVPLSATVSDFKELLFQFFEVPIVCQKLKGIEKRGLSSPTLQLLALELDPVIFLEGNTTEEIEREPSLLIGADDVEYSSPQAPASRSYSSLVEPSAVPSFPPVSSSGSGAPPMPNPWASQRSAVPSYSSFSQSSFRPQPQSGRLPVPADAYGVEAVDDAEGYVHVSSPPSFAAPAGLPLPRQLSFTELVNSILLSSAPSSLSSSSIRHPEFIPDFQDAVGRARATHKFLFVLLHSSTDSRSTQFIKNVICNEDVISSIENYCVFFGCDIVNSSESLSLNKFLERNPGVRVQMQPSDYPFIALLGSLHGEMAILDTIQPAALIGGAAEGPESFSGDEVIMRVLQATENHPTVLIGDDEDEDMPYVVGSRVPPPPPPPSSGAAQPRMPSMAASRRPAYEVIEDDDEDEERRTQRAINAALDDDDDGYVDEDEDVRYVPSSSSSYRKPKSHAAVLREEQDQAYLQSLKDDQEREKAAKDKQERERREAEEAEQSKQLEEALKMSMQQEAENNRRRKEEELGPEPSASEPNTATVAIRMPDGARINRRFKADDTLSKIFDFLDCKHQIDANKCELVMNFPSRRFKYTSAEAGQSLKSLDLVPQVAFFLNIQA